MPPASELKKAASASAPTLYMVVLMPITCAASSSSRMATSPAPKRLRASQATVPVAATSRTSESS